jgi:ADP-heptose:LPS heptosyltransferase
MSRPNAVCTIVSKNYLSFARTFAETYTAHNPDEQVFVLLVDKVEGYFDPKSEKFTLIEVEDIGIENIHEMLLRYSVIELNTAVKPFFLEYLFKKYNFEKVIYFDPDIMVMGKLDELWSILDKDDIILTPHITAPIEDENTPSERNILQAGTFNLGFIAVKNTPNVNNMLAWWQKRLRKYCFMDVAKGYHVDQKWMNFVPYMFEKVNVLCAPEYNAAYWNMHERFITDKDGVKVNGRPIKFFHFSGFSPDNSELISKHQNRFTLGMREDVRSLFDTYAKLVLKNGYSETRKWPYAYSYNKGAHSTGRGSDNGKSLSKKFKGTYRGLMGFALTPLVSVLLDFKLDSRSLEKKGRKKKPPDIRLNAKFAILRAKFIKDDYKDAIVLFRPHGVGDLLMGLPAFKKLRQKYPKRKIILYVYNESYHLMRMFDFFDEVIALPRSFDYQKYLDLVPRPKGSQFYDLIIELERNPSGNNLNNLYNKLNRNLIISKALGVGDSYEKVAIPEDKDAQKRVQKLVSDYHIDPSRMVTITFEATNKARCWYPEYYKKFIDHILAKGYQAVIVGSKDRNEDLFPDNKECINLIKKTASLNDVVELTRISRMVVSVDTYLCHMAGLMDIPVLAIFTGGVAPNSRVSYYKKKVVAESEYRCYCWDMPCRYEDRVGNELCRVGLKPAHVIEAFDNLVDEKYD